MYECAVQKKKPLGCYVSKYEAAQIFLFFFYLQWLKLAQDQSVGLSAWLSVFLWWQFIDNDIKITVKIILPLKLRAPLLNFTPFFHWPWCLPELISFPCTWTIFFSPLDLSLIIIECQCLALGLELACPLLGFFFFSQRTEKTQIQSMHSLGCHFPWHSVV